MVGSKNPGPAFLSAEEADAHCRAGASVWKFASTDDGVNPDVVIAGIGAELTFEVIKAAELLREMIPALRVRVVNVTDLMVLGNDGAHPHSLSSKDFDALFTSDRPVHFNYHGYAAELKGLLFGRTQCDRISIESYREEGSTTTPFDMMLLNKVCRYHVAQAALQGGALLNEKVQVDLVQLQTQLRHRISKTREYIVEHGKDPDDTYAMPQFERSSSD